MTAETRYYIELSDILGVEFACHEYGGKTVLDAEAKKSFLSSCPLCNATWLYPQTDEEKTLRTFVTVIKTAKEKMSGRPFSLRLRVAHED